MHPIVQLTPQHPTIVDGMSTFQLRLRQGCVRTGIRIKVHVEANSGRGDQVRCATRCERRRLLCLIRPDTVSAPTSRAPPAQCALLCGHGAPMDLCMYVL